MPSRGLENKKSCNVYVCLKVIFSFLCEKLIDRTIMRKVKILCGLYMIMLLVLFNQTKKCIQFTFLYLYCYKDYEERKNGRMKDWKERRNKGRMDGWIVTDQAQISDRDCLCNSWCVWKYNKNLQRYRKAVEFKTMVSVLLKFLRHFVSVVTS